MTISKKPLGLRPSDEFKKNPKIKALAGGCLKESDYLVRRYTAKVPVSHTLKDIESPMYFHYYADLLAKARGFGPVKLEVISDDCSIHAEYLVLEATRAGVRLRRLAVHHDASELPEVTAEGSVLENGSGDTDQFSKNWSAKDKYRILSYGDVVAKNVQSKETADELVGRLNAGTMTLDELPSEYMEAASK